MLSRAAAELAVTTGAVSRQIKNLEEHVGVALFARDGRGIRLTADGEALESGLGDAFAQIAAAVERLRRPLRGERLRIVTPSIFASAWLIPRLGRFNRLRPAAEVILIDSDNIVSATGDNTLVVGWGRFTSDATTIAERLVDEEEAFPVCSRHACPEQGSLDRATLLYHHAVGNAWSWPDWSTFLAAVGRSDVDCGNPLYLTSALMLETARQGKGVMLANKTISHDDIAAGRLVRPIAESMPLDDSYWLLTARAASERPEVKAFRTWLKAEFDNCFGQKR